MCSRPGQTAWKWLVQHRCTDLLNEHIRPSLLLVFDIMYIQVSEFIFTDVCVHVCDCNPTEKAV